jgi:hypothetical protein
MRSWFCILPTQTRFTFRNNDGTGLLIRVLRYRVIEWLFYQGPFGPRPQPSGYGIPHSGLDLNIRVFLSNEDGWTPNVDFVVLVQLLRLVSVHIRHTRGITRAHLTSMGSQSTGKAREGKYKEMNLFPRYYMIVSSIIILPYIVILPLSSPTAFRHKCILRSSSTVFFRYHV